MRPFTKIVVQTCVTGTLVVAFSFVITWVILSPNFVTLLLASCVVIGISYFVFIVSKPMIQFTSINLKVALKGISANNCGTYIYAFVCAELAIGWFIYWIYSTIGLYSYLDLNVCNANQSNQAVTAQMMYDLSTTTTGEDSGSNGGGIAGGGNSSNNKEDHWWYAFDPSKDSAYHLDANVEGGGVGDDDDGCGTIKFLWFVFLILSLYWTNTVIMVSEDVVVFARFCPRSVSITNLWQLPNMRIEYCPSYSCRRHGNVVLR